MATTVTFTIDSIQQPPSGRGFVGLIRSGTETGFTQHPNTGGVAVQTHGDYDAFDPDAHSGTPGGLAFYTNGGTRHTVSTWDWDAASINDGATLTLELTDTSYQLTITDATFSNLTGALSGPLPTALSNLPTSVDVYSANQGFFVPSNGLLKIAIDRIQVEKTSASTPVNLSVSSTTGTEAGTTAITVTATADSAVSGDQTVDLAVTGTNITVGDYTLTDGDAAPGIQIKILDGQTTGTVTFTVQDDSLVEGDETATLTISNPSAGVLLGTTTSQNITITDDDYETEVTLVGNTLTITDDGGGTSDDDLTISFAGGVYTITDGGGLTIDVSSIPEAGNSGTASVTIPQGSIDAINVLTLGGSDEVTVNSTGSGVAVTIDGGADADTVTWDSTVVIGALSVTAETINLDSGTVDTGSGDQTYTGRLVLGANTVLSGGSMTFDATINSDATERDLTINAGGATEFNGLVGGVTVLKSIKVNSTGSTVEINTAINVGVGGLDIDPPDTINVNAPINSAGGPVNLEANNGVTLSGANADVTTGGGAFTVNADFDNNGTGGYVQNDAGSAVATGGGIVAITAADVALTGTINTAAGTVTLAPTNGHNIDLGASGGAGSLC